ncbi:uncharacterized protein LOC127874889 isoform X2 [Dreissena polymorpha]|uniref:uncharacterized protein LOC127874889 isoform X2 n=1 Tax=Dreissena polymorpha TaxID=45954 RepID=UPI0022655400|nr:uncharacterized protein LOC127874889 isoform X2 [Dreissena polymorpha]
MNIGCLIFAGVLLTTELSESLECFNCQNIGDQHSCTNTSQCSNGQIVSFHQSCFSQTVHVGSYERYNMGCQNNQLCSSSGVNTFGIIGRSIQTMQHYACHECCSTSGCNDQYCAHRKHGGWSSWVQWESWTSWEPWQSWTTWQPWQSCSAKCDAATQDIYRPDSFRLRQGM